MNELGIPKELKDCKQWVIWKIEVKDDKLTKVPYRADTPNIRASTTNPKSWSTFDQATFTLKNEKDIAGIGFVFSEDDPYVGIDFDKCVEPTTGLVYPSIEQDILSLQSYTEISHSGKGIHVIGKGTNPDPEGKGNKKANIELYSRGRYFAITGNPYRDFPTTINTISDPLMKTLYLKYFITGPKDTKPKTIEQFKDRNNLFLADEEILSICEHAHNSSKFISLWHGSISGYPSQSEADMALGCIFAFYTKDTSQLQRLLCNSGLYRSKMDRTDYIKGVITKSVSMIRESYDPKAQMRKRWVQRRIMIGDTRG
jgi:primase-polymerase (primpol)-like protein